MRTTDPLFVAVTRPAVRWGVPWDGIRANAMITLVFTAVVIGNPLGFMIGVGVHFAMRELCRVDPHFFHKWKLWTLTKAKSTTGVLWGGSRIQPSPTKVRRSREVRSAV